MLDRSRIQHVAQLLLPLPICDCFNIPRMTSNTSAGSAANNSLGCENDRCRVLGDVRFCRGSPGFHWLDSKESKLVLLLQEELRAISDRILSRDNIVEEVAEEPLENLRGELSATGGKDSEDFRVGD